MWWLIACGPAPHDEPSPPTSATDPMSAPPSTTTPPPPAPVSGCAVDRWDPATFSTVIDVGPGYAASTPSDVPWESLTPSTLVRIQPGEYHDKWAIDVAGTEADPIVVIGICVPATGALPVIDGADAITRLELDFWSETRGVLKIGGTSTGSAVVPSWIFVEDLEFRGGRAGNSFVDESGADDAYDDNAAAIFVEEGQNVTIRGCTLADSGNGLFAAHETRALLVSSNHIFGNGNVDSAYEHNNYTEALGIVFEYNRFGPLCDGCSGNNLKDRSAGLVVRYNWIEGGNRQLDLVESDFDDIRDDPSYRETFVYGNILVEPDGDGNSQIAHYGGDNGDESIYRQGTLFFYHNTVVSERVGNTTLFRLSTSAELADVRNNIVYAAGNLAVLDAEGSASLATNWLTAGWADSFQGAAFTGSVTEAGGNVEGEDPMFSVDYALDPASPARGIAGPLADGAPPVASQYLVHQGGAARTSTADAGAVEP